MTEYCFHYPQNGTYYYLYQRYPNFPNLAVEVRMSSLHPCGAIRTLVSGFLTDRIFQGVVMSDGPPDDAGSVPPSCMARV